MEYHENFSLENIIYFNNKGVECVEQWKDIIDYEGLYRISILGRVMSLNYNGTGEIKIMKYRIGQVGYRIINFHKNLKRKTKTIHRLLALHFIDNPENKKEVNHIDGIKSNYNIENLEWCTRSENKIHAHRIGLEKTRKGSKSNFSILTEEQVIEIRKIGSSMLQREIGVIYGVNRITIGDILRRKNWKHI